MNQIREVFPCRMVRDAKAASNFYQPAFGATDLLRLLEPSGRIGHAEMQLGPAVLMVCDEFPECRMVGPQCEQFTSCKIHLQVDNADEIGERAIAAGATKLMPPTDQFYGERSCRHRDPIGHAGLLGHSIETVEPEEMRRRCTAMMAGQVRAIGRGPRARRAMSIWRPAVRRWVTRRR